MRSEIGAVYGPLLVAYTGISVATGSTAGEEEAGILALIARPPDRALAPACSRKAAAVAVSVALVALGTLLGLVVGVAVGGGGIALANMAALALHLMFFGWADRRACARAGGVDRSPGARRRRGRGVRRARLPAQRLRADGRRDSTG